MFPDYHKKYDVSVAEFTFRATPNAFSKAKLKANGQGILQMEHLAYDVFYPSTATSIKGFHWLPGPAKDSVAGYAKFLGTANALMWPFIHLYGRFLKMPVSDHAPFAPSSTLPLVIFSHGLAGGRTTYSQYCGMLAAQGFIVIAVEHRDGSGPMCSIPSKQGKHTPLFYTKVDEVEWPAGTDETGMPLRADQLGFRLTEIYAIYASFCNLLRGDRGTLNLLDGRKMSDDWWSKWTAAGHLVDAADLSLIGHSFGGATALHLLSSTPPDGFDHPLPLSRVLILDPWLEPLASPGPNPQPHYGTESPVRFTVINSEAFTIWTDHFARLEDLVRSWKKKDDLQALMTLARAGHQDVSDFSLMVPFSGGKAMSYLETLHTLTIAFIKDDMKATLESNELGPRIKRTLEIEKNAKDKKVIRGVERDDIIVHAL